MAYAEFAPPAALRPYVSCVWHLHTGETAADKRILPDGCVDLLFVRSGNAPGRLLWVGAMRRAEVVRLDPFALHVGVRFRPGAATAFLGRPASELTDQNLDPSEIWHHTSALEDRFALLTSCASVQQALVQTLLERLPQAPALDASIVRWAGRMLDTPPDVSVTKPALIGDRQQRRRFTAAVGIAPKHFARVARMQWLLRMATPHAPWSELALAAGYYDQAHLIHDFASLTGTSPGAYFAEMAVSYNR